MSETHELLERIREALAKQLHHAKQGGHARAKKLTAEQRRNISSMGGKAKAQKRRKA